MVNDEITEKIISCAYTVMNTLGAGFLEKVYENSLVIELQKNGFKVNQQVPINYLRATNLKIGLLINFGKAKVEIKRLFI